MKKFAILAALVLLALLLYHYGGREWLLPETYRVLYAKSPWLTTGLFFVSYLLMTALSIPGAGVMSLVAGAIFGLGTGVLLVSFASSLGATAACLIARLLLRDWVARRFARQLKKIDAGVARDGPYYLFGLRLVPIFPFFMINLVMGLTTMPLWVFYLVSQAGHVTGHHRVRERRCAAGNHLRVVGRGHPYSRGGHRPGAPGGTAVRGPRVHERAARAPRFTGRGAPGGRVPSIPTCWSSVPAAPAGQCLYRRCHASKGKPNRTSPHGRRLPEYRLRAQQGIDPLGTHDALRGPRRGLRHPPWSRAAGFFPP